MIFLISYFGFNSFFPPSVLDMIVLDTKASASVSGLISVMSVMEEHKLQNEDTAGRVMLELNRELALRS